MKKTEPTSFVSVSPLIRGAIKDSITKALKARPHKVNVNVPGIGVELYEIDGEMYSMEAAIKKILGEYSWWNE